MVSLAVSLLRFTCFLSWTLLLLLPFLVLRMVAPRTAAGYVRAYWRGVVRMTGFRVVVRGTPVEGGGPVLFVANHVSYLDIVVLGSLVRAFFIAKGEVAGWPGFGFLARIARTVFVDRRPGASARERDNIRRRLDEGGSLILFAESTSTDGNRVLPFKSALFAVAEAAVTGADGVARPLPVQPVSIAYTRLDGLPLCRAFRPYLAWYGDMTLAGHLLRALGLGRVTVEVMFHPPTTLTGQGSRKELALHCHTVVTHGLTRMLAGRQA